MARRELRLRLVLGILAAFSQRPVQAGDLPRLQGGGPVAFAEPVWPPGTFPAA